MMELYPNNPSLGEELVRLFDKRITLTLDDCFTNRLEVEEDFNKNGRDCDYNDPEMYGRQCEAVAARHRNPARKSSMDDWDELYSLPEMKMTSSPKYGSPQKRLAPMKNLGECVFCRNNGEMSSCYKSHTLKDRFGRVTCPILRAYTCPICKASGDEAHTVRYCPKNKSKEAYIPRMVNLRSFVRSSTGKKILLH